MHLLHKTVLLLGAAFGTSIASINANNNSRMWSNQDRSWYLHCFAIPCGKGIAYGFTWPFRTKILRDYNYGMCASFRQKITLQTNVNSCHQRQNSGQYKERYQKR